MQGTKPSPGASGGIQVTVGPEVCLRTATGLAGVGGTLACQGRPVIYQQIPVEKSTMQGRSNSGVHRYSLKFTDIRRYSPNPGKKFQPQMGIAGHGSVSQSDRYTLTMNTQGAGVRVQAGQATTARAVAPANTRAGRPRSKNPANPTRKFPICDLRAGKGCLHTPLWRNRTGRRSSLTISGHGSSKIGDLKFQKRPMKSPMPDGPTKLNQIKPRTFAICDLRGG
jgi:hypothetical protein